ncbi:MAG: hypothetical protein CM1200mP9_09880 [Gammaproteobacteria bacterium]|nr:MAG: hypothetical protein CM1200mP9_09880 [Gammaproteobacteria bacterium]
MGPRFYYDPIVDHVHKVGSGGGTGVAWYALPPKT